MTHVQLRPGSLLQPRHPAALGLRAHMMYRVLNRTLGTLAQASEGQTPAGSGDYVLYMLRSLDPKTGHFTLLIDGIGVGQGARPFGDGLDVIYSSRGQKSLSKAFNFPVSRISLYSLSLFLSSLEFTGHLSNLILTVLVVLGTFGL